MYEYTCKVNRVVDGDTVDVDIDLGFGITYSNQRIRLLGLDAPESRTRDLNEKRFGILAKEFLENELRKAEATGRLVIRTNVDEKGKFGRILGEFFYEDEHQMWVSINDVMIGQHHAVEYHGQSKADIKKEHIKNRGLLNDTV